MIPILNRIWIPMNPMGNFFYTSPRLDLTKTTTTTTTIEMGFDTIEINLVIPVMTCYDKLRFAICDLLPDTGS